jgi:hypothetical protein
MTKFNEQAEVDLALERIDQSIYQSGKEAKAELGKMVQAAHERIDALEQDEFADMIVKMLGDTV